MPAGLRQCRLRWTNVHFKNSGVPANHKYLGLKRNGVWHMAENTNCAFLTKEKTLMPAAWDQAPATPARL
jgi:hypothetical protein